MTYKNPEGRNIYRANNKDKIAAQKKIWYANNKDQILIQKKIYQANNKEKISARMKIWRTNNKEKLAAKRKIYEAKRMKTDIVFKMARILRSRIRDTLNGNSKSARTAELLGCSIKYFLNYIESQFDDEMNWSNYGIFGWHLHHIIPCETFDLIKPEEQKKCFHYSNQKPLWHNLHLGLMAHGGKR